MCPWLESPARSLLRMFLLVPHKCILFPLQSSIISRSLWTHPQCTVYDLLCSEAETKGVEVSVWTYISHPSFMWDTIDCGPAQTYNDNHNLFLNLTMSLLCADIVWYIYFKHWHIAWNNVIIKCDPVSTFLSGLFLGTNFTKMKRKHCSHADHEWWSCHLSQIIVSCK